MAGLNEAYETLSNSLKRSAYDRERRRERAEAKIRTERYARSTVYQRPSSTTGPDYYYEQPIRQTYTTKSDAKKRTPLSWWAPLAWGIGLMILVVGGILYLPVSQATGASTPPSSMASSSTNSSVGDSTSSQPVSQSNDSISTSSTPNTPSSSDQNGSTSADQSTTDNSTTPKSVCTFNPDGTLCGQSSAKTVCADATTRATYLKCIRQNLDCQNTTTGDRACSTTCGSTTTVNGSPGYSRCY